MRKLTDPLFVGKWFPIGGAAFFLWGYLGQIWHMWSQHTAAGQSLVGWLELWLALWAYWHFYRTCCPKETIAIWSVFAEIVVNWFVILSVIRFQYLPY